MFAPGWVFDVAVSRTALEFLSSELAIDAFANKYANGLSEIYSEPIPTELISETAQKFIEFLGEIEAGELAVELLHDYSYYRLYFEGANRPRKMKSMFGTVEDAVKTLEYNSDTTLKNFRAFIFGMRSNTVPKAPAGWKIEADEHISKLKDTIEKPISVLDMF